MEFYEHQKTKYDIPLSHLDHKYIPECKNVNELEKILRVLRSGTEGSFPDLEKLAEEQIAKLDPNNKLLRKSGKPLFPKDLEEGEYKELQDFLGEWEEEANEKEKNLTKTAAAASGVGNDLPPVRNVAAKIPTDKEATTTGTDTQKAKEKRVKPRDYREWDRFDIDAELNKVEETNGESCEKKKTVTGKSQLEETVDGSGLSLELKQIKENYERKKGNEAFGAGDFDEAIAYYNRSISVLPTAAAYNNRALVYLKQKKWNNALDDCNTVLMLESGNLKAILRRASAYQGLTRYPQAKKDLDVVLQKEPNNKHALGILSAVEKALDDQKISGRRMTIEEVAESDSETVSSQSGRNELLSSGEDRLDSNSGGKKIEKDKGSEILKKCESNSEGELKKKKVPTATLR